MLQLYNCSNKEKDPFKYIRTITEITKNTKLIVKKSLPIDQHEVFVDYNKDVYLHFNGL